MPLSADLPAPLPSFWHPEASSLLHSVISISCNFSLTFPLGNNWIQQHVFWVNMSIFWGISLIAFSLIQVQGLWPSWIFVSLSSVVVLIAIVRPGLSWRSRRQVQVLCVVPSEGLLAPWALPLSHCRRRSPGTRSAPLQIGELSHTPA